MQKRSCLAGEGLGLDLGSERQLDALGDAVFQTSGGQLVLEVVEDDRNERASNHADQTIVRTDVLADEVGLAVRRISGGFNVLSVSLLRGENFAVVVRAEFEGITTEGETELGSAYKEILVLADLGELQFEFSAVCFHSSLDGTSGLFDGKAISGMNGLLGMGLVNKIELNVPLFLTEIVRVAFDNQFNKFSFDFVNTNAFILSKGLP